MNCIDNNCKHTYSEMGEIYCSLTHEEIPDDIDIVQCDKFEQSQTCINCKYSKETVYETGTIDNIEYRCILQDNKLMYDDMDPYHSHFADVPECSIDMFEQEK